MNFWDLLMSRAPQTAALPEEAVPQQVPPERFSLPKKKPVPVGPPLPSQSVMPPMETVPTGPVAPPSREPAGMGIPRRPGRALSATAPNTQALMNTAGLTPEQQAVIEELLGQQEGELERQRQLVKKAEALEAETDLRPLAAFVDSMTGSRFASGVTAPFTEADRLKLISQLRENVAQGQEKLTSTKLKQMMGEENLDMRKIGLLMAGQGRQIADERKAEKMDRDISDRAFKASQNLQTHPLMKKLQEQDAAFSDFDTLIQEANDGNAVAFNSLGTKLAKAMGEVGVLTDRDVTRYIDTYKLDRKFLDTVNKWKTGRATPDTMEELQHIAHLMKETAARKIGGVVDRQANILMRNYGMSKQEAYERLGYEDLYMPDSAKPKANAAPKEKEAALTPAQQKVADIKARIAAKKAELEKTKAGK